VDDWHIRIDTRYHHEAAGSGARGKQRELAPGKGGVQRWVEGFLDVRSADRSWRRGAEGEERVGRLLAELGDGWSVVHDLTIGRKGANLDHLVIGPAGVFALNTKHLTGRITVHARSIRHNGHRTAFVPAALREARTVQTRLAAATGRPITAWSVLVVMGCEIVTKAPPADLSVVPARQIAGWLQRLPDGKLTAGEVLTLERAARDPDTWQVPSGPRRTRSAPARPSPAASIDTRPASSSPVEDATLRRSSPPPRRPGDTAVGTADEPPRGVSVRRWRRFGKDRFYANAVDGTRLGYIEVASDEVVLDVADPHGLVAAQLRAARRALGRDERRG
jgi:hypothetical protein